MRRDGGSVFPARANTGDPNGPVGGLSANEIARALISMMARSTTCSNQRPDTLMRDRICRIEENLLQRTAGPYIWVNHVVCKCDEHFRFNPVSDHNQYRLTVGLEDLIRSGTAYCTAPPRAVQPCRETVRTSPGSTFSLRSLYALSSSGSAVTGRQRATAPG